MTLKNDSLTLQFYASLQAAFDHFNAEIFESALPPCLITLRSAPRVCGYHHVKRFISPSGEFTDELGINPRIFCDPVNRRNPFDRSS